jgi:hypothetical protein
MLICYNVAMGGDQTRILRAMTPAQQIRAAERLIESARELKAAAIRAQHPDWPEDQVQRTMREAFLRARS